MLLAFFALGRNQNGIQVPRTGGLKTGRIHPIRNDNRNSSIRNSTRVNAISDGNEVGTST